MDPNGSSDGLGGWSLDDLERYLALQSFLPKNGGLFGSGWARYMADQQDSANGSATSTLMARAQQKPPLHAGSGAELPRPRSYVDTPLPPNRSPPPQQALPLVSLQAPRPNLDASAPQNEQSINCSSRLPDGSTVGDKVRQLYGMINKAENEGNVLSGAATFFQGVNTGGILDFKNTFRGSARNGYSGSYLAAAGNFAYGAAAGNYLGDSSVGRQIGYMGGSGYALSHGKAAFTPPGTIFPQDASGAANIPAGLKSGGCF